MKHATTAKNAAARNLSNFASVPILLPRPSHYRSICKLVAVNTYASSMKMAIGLQAKRKFYKASPARKLQ
jgi:hypothetical protein